MSFCTNLVNQQPCNECHNCVRINENEHPDVLRIAPDGQTIKVNQIRELKSGVFLKKWGRDC